MQRINLYIILTIIAFLSTACASYGFKDQDIAIMPYEQRLDGTIYTADDQVKTSVGGFAGSGNLNRTKLLDANSQ